MFAVERDFLPLVCFFLSQYNSGVDMLCLSKCAGCYLERVEECGVVENHYSRFNFACVVFL